ncbi:class F sortase [Metabacillus hrfriensis]|uniref:Class F sortase n=1 Tax=Metabacillus hrfriensis TaxID=3048891 RepID=A0ACD4REX0_9BACI|nr:class F sortase [Metabacillus sp. CT-WN-B3]WHZ59036.1 class F sortase [Metabacillus sp. CT-WN-B3]
MDSKTGPAIFYTLIDLKQDDEITVTDEKGTALTFIVKKQESYIEDQLLLMKFSRQEQAGI